MPRRKAIPIRNRSPYGWWIFCEVQQWVDTKRKTPPKRFLVWENTRLIQARTREQAYRKAVKLASSGYPMETSGGEWRFAGISLLLPVYEKLEDGAEIRWHNHGNIGTSAIRRLVKTKLELEAFLDDT